MKILVIDDDAMVRYTVGKVLEEGDFNVLIAADGKQGMEIFRREHPDVVITDLIMPEQEGIETIIEMKRERPETRIVAMSGGGRIANTDLLQAARRLGADEVLAKPFEPDALLSYLAGLSSAG